MSLINDLITYICENSSTFNTIEHAWSMQPFDDPENNAPALLLFPGKQKSSDNRSEICTVQECNKDINIFIIAEISELEAIIDEVNSLVQGWQYNSNHLPMMHLEGDPQEIKGKYIWFLETYTTTYQRRSS